MIIPKPISNFMLIIIISLLTAILFANTVMVVICIVPFLLLTIGSILKLPSGIEVARTLDKEILTAGDIVRVTIDVRIESGVGVVILSDPLPKQFQMVDGSNYAVVWKSPAVKSFKFFYAVRCTISGEYQFSNVAWIAGHCLYNHLVSGSTGEEAVIEVHPRLLETRRMRSVKTKSSIPIPLGSLAKMGSATLEFSEIRNYVSQDSFKHINWKATSRNVYRGGLWPVVNDYEKEGKKCVWIFLDCSKEMSFGTNVINAFECSLEALCGLTDFYLKQRCYVAFCTFNGEDAFIYPGAEKKQYHRIIKEVLKMKSRREKAQTSSVKNVKSLETTVKMHRSYFFGVRPMFIVITRYSDQDEDRLWQGIGEINKYTVGKREKSQVLVVNISGYDMAAGNQAERISSSFLTICDRISSDELRKKCLWIDWNPMDSSFSSALFKQVVKR